MYNILYTELKQVQKSFMPTCDVDGCSGNKARKWSNTWKATISSTLNSRRRQRIRYSSKHVTGLLIKSLRIWTHKFFIKEYKQVQALQK